MKKEDLEYKITETIRIISCIHPDNKEEIKKYQTILNEDLEYFKSKYKTTYQNWSKNENKL